MNIEPRINIKRLMANIDDLAKLGRNEGGGIDRAFGSEAEREAREWLIHYWKSKLKLPVRIDAIANLWVDYPPHPEAKRLILGSHHDTVPDGGAYDGALGVLMATEILETLLEKQITLKHPVSIVSFTGEEPNPYNVSTLGSKVITGRLSTGDLLQLKNRRNYETLECTIAKLGGNIHKAEEAILDSHKAAAFLECHIEQGKRLETRGKAVAAVNCITGIHREMYTILGEANHAGTTVMTERKDALLTAAQLSLAIEKIALDFKDGDVVATTGYLEMEPNEANIIPGKVISIADIRTYRPEIEALFEERISEAVADIEEERGVRIQREILLKQGHMPMAMEVIQAVERGISSIGEEPVQLISMAGHDAANLARVTKSGMIFAASVAGKSHCKEEYTREEDIEKAGNAMLQAVLILDGELDT